MSDSLTIQIGRAMGKPIGHLLSFIPPQKRRAVLVWLLAISLAGWISYATYQEGQVVHYRKTLTPLGQAVFDREHGNLSWALSDLRAIKPDSAEFDRAQELIPEVEAEIENRREPHSIRAGRNCKQAAKDGEEFPSTINFVWFGVEVTPDKATKTIGVTVDYTAKNSMGAELPYRMTCITNYDGEVTNTSRTGR